MKELYLRYDRRMDRFDALLCEYQRANHVKAEKLCEKLGLSRSTLWRYRTNEEAFRQMPNDILAICFRLTNASNETIRYILGLPNGKTNEN